MDFDIYDEKDFSDKSFDLQLSPWLSGSVIDMYKESRENHDLNSKDRITLLAAADAVCACLSAVSPDGKYSIAMHPDNDLPIEAWAARSIHAFARAVYDDDSALWGYVARRLTGGYDHLWKFSCPA